MPNFTDQLQRARAIDLAAEVARAEAAEAAEALRATGAESSKVASVAAGSTRVSIGGTATAPTVDVAVDATATDIAAIAPNTGQGAGSTGKVADAGHTHPQADPLGWGITTWFSPGAPLINLNTANGWTTANTASFARLIGYGGAVTKVRVRVGTASGNVDAGFYANSGSGLSATPAARQGSLGGIACPAAGMVDMALTASATPKYGDWMAFVCDNTTAIIYQAGTGPSTFTVMSGQSGSQATAYPLPSPASITGGLGPRMPYAVGVP